jgi:hypothetical protein
MDSDACVMQSIWETSVTAFLTNMIGLQTWIQISVATTDVSM